jgi:nitroreductase
LFLSRIDGKKGFAMEFQELIRARRSIRGFRPDPIPKESLLRILEAARVAPTAANRQPFQIIVVTDPVTRARFKEAYDRDWLWPAPVILVGCVEPAKAWQRSDGFNAAEVDLSIVMDHMILAAADVGLGTCWICNFDESKTKEILGIPADVRVIAITPLGFPAAEPRLFQRKSLGELVRRDRW